MLGFAWIELVVLVLVLSAVAHWFGWSLPSRRSSAVRRFMAGADSSSATRRERLGLVVMAALVLLLGGWLAGR